MALMAVGVLLSVPAWSGVEGLDDEDNAKLSRSKARTATVKGQSRNKLGKGAAGDDQKCGNVEIGNVSNSRPGRPTKNVTVVVEGPVINANNRCR
jgi:hypothetical protein